MRDWNAAAYHRVSNPQLEWGLPVLARLRLDGDELVLDVGCGTGRLTRKLLERLPRGRVVAVDRSASMVAAARNYLLPQHARQLAVAQADAAALPFVAIADAVFSTATFHWVPDHDRLFTSIFEALKPGGRLVAQAGGGPNLQRIHERSAVLMNEPAFAPHFARWINPWEFADAETTARRLHNAGFQEIETEVVPSPVRQPDAAAYREFVEHVICRPHLSYLPTPELRDQFLDRLTDAAAGDAPPFELDYWRLNLDARKPTRQANGNTR
jgi:trans-aconitate 2-methyltransferase